MKNEFMVNERLMPGWGRYGTVPYQDTQRPQLRGQFETPKYQKKISK